MVWNKNDTGFLLKMMLIVVKCLVKKL